MIVSCNVCFLLVPHFDLDSSGIFRADCQLAAVSTLLSTPAIPSLCLAFFPPKNEGPPKPFSGQLATYAEVVPLCISARSLASFSHKITIHLLGNVFQSRNAVSHLVTSYHLTTHSCAPEKPNSLKNSNRECALGCHARGVMRRERQVECTCMMDASYQLVCCSGSCSSVKNLLDVPSKHALTTVSACESCCCFRAVDEYWLRIPELKRVSLDQPRRAVFGYGDHSARSCSVPISFSAGRSGQLEWRDEHGVLQFGSLGRWRIGRCPEQVEELFGHVFQCGGLCVVGGDNLAERVGTRGDFTPRLSKDAIRHSDGWARG